MAETSNRNKAIALRSVEEHAKSVKQRTRARNVAIHNARNQGATLREIGDAAGLTHPGVKKILDRGKPSD